MPFLSSIGISALNIIRGGAAGEVAPSYSFGDALVLDGVDDFVTLPSLVSSSTITISLWVKFDVLNPNEALLGSNDNQDTFRVQNGNNRIQIKTSLGNASDNDFTIPSLSINTWYHIYFADNGAQARLFLNGVESTSGAQNSGDNYNFIYIGNQGNGVFLDGVIDDFLITNTYGNPSTEAAAIYNGGAGADPLSVIPTAQQLYRFNNNANNDGSLGGTATLNNFAANPYITH